MKSTTFTVVNVIIEHFIPYRNFTRTSTKTYDNDTISTILDTIGYVRIDVLDKAGGKVAIIVLGVNSAPALHTPDLKVLLSHAVSSELSELVLVAESEFYDRKNLVDTVNMYRECYFTLCKYLNFICNIPAHPSVPQHTTLSEEEAATFLKVERIKYSDLPIILTTDAPIIWLGAREKQIVKILIDSPISVFTYHYRRVERGI